MGTNYYVRIKKCKHCGYKPDDIHLGKSSGGWAFIFQFNGGKYYKNISEMKSWLKGKRIRDEYGRRISYREFWNIITKPEEGDLCHTEVYPSESNFIIDGCSFSDTDYGNW